MSSSKSLERKQFALEIANEGIEMAPCTSCRNARPRKGDPKPKCILGPRSGRCSECVRKGYTDCDVTVSRPEWEKLRDARDSLRKDIEKIEEEEVELLQKLAARRAKKIQLRKRLRLSERRTENAVAQELEDLEAAEAVESEFLPPEDPAEPAGFEISEPPFPFFDIVEMPPTDWDQILAGVGPVGG